VGFVMLHYGVSFDDGLDVPGYFLWRFMIAQPYQGLGFGSRALKLIIEHVKSKGENLLLTSCYDGEGGPEEFYRKFGFKRDGDTYGDEIGLCLKL
jgi:Acetyltransferase (GNAT) family.